MENEHWPFMERPPPETIDREEEYEVEGIVDHKREKGGWWYFIKWKGYVSSENTWEPVENLKGCAAMIAAFNKKESQSSEASKSNTKTRSKSK